MGIKSKAKVHSSESHERRRVKRRPVLETFSIFAVVPKKGLHRLQIYDLSELGVGFDLDIEGEPTTAFPIREGDFLDFRLYLNSSLYIPLTVQVARIEERHTGRHIGSEFHDKESENYKTFVAFLNFLDSAVSVLQIE